MAGEKSFLGRGWGFPPEFDESSKTLRMVSEEEDIAESLRIIIFTAPGERIMRPDFGCGIHYEVFSPVNSITLNKIQDAIEKAILEYEPRVTLNLVEIDDSNIYEDGELKILIDYTIRKINVRTNKVFPFYIKEGTNITGF